MRLSNERYEEIKREIAYTLEDYDITTVPIDVFDLAKRMKVSVVFSSKKLETTNGYMSYFDSSRYPPSFLYYNKSEQKYIVYIDNIGTKYYRQRFSLAHELMHIILRHIEQNDENESEANFGAQYMLAPACLIFLSPENPLMYKTAFIQRAFDVSKPVATAASRFFLKRFEYYDSDLKDYECIIINQLRNSFMLMHKSELEKYEKSIKYNMK